MELDPAALQRLREELIARGRPSLVPTLPPTGSAPAPAPETEDLRAQIERVAPICEVLYLMMMADGKLEHGERELLRGAVRALTDNTLRSHRIDAMLAQFEARLAAEGRPARLEHVCARLVADRADAEAAYSLAAAMALADAHAGSEETTLLDELGDMLGISNKRRKQLTDPPPSPPPEAATSR